MLRNYYSIFDKLADQFGDLMFCSSDEVAKREFVNIVRKYHINKDDLELYRLGKFDDEKGVFIGDNNGRCLVVAGKDINVPNIEGLEEILFRLTTLEQICKERKENA